MNEKIKAFALAMVTDLVDRGIIAREVNGTWTLTQVLLGYNGDVAFPSKRDLIQGVANAAAETYGGQAGLREAV